MQGRRAVVENIFIDHGRVVVAGYIHGLGAGADSEPRIWTAVGDQRQPAATAQFWHAKRPVGARRTGRPYRFLVEVGLAELPTRVQIGMAGSSRPLPMEFVGYNAGLNTRVGAFYRRFGDGTAASYRRGSLHLHRRLAGWRVLAGEAAILLRLLVSRQPMDAKRRLADLRLRYWRTRRTLGRRRIWLYNDKTYKAGDNAEYLFRHAVAQPDDIDHLFVINPGNAHHQRLVDDGFADRVLTRGSVEAKIAALHSEQILVTHADRLKYLGFSPDEAEFCANLVTARSVTAFHGLNIPHVPSSLQRQRDNSVLSFCASDFERRALLHPDNGFGPDNLPVLGAPRFDGLVPATEPIILIAPTWRSGIDGDFLASAYFAAFDGVLRDQALIAAAHRLGYRLQFLLHPVFSRHAGHFSGGDGVEVIDGRDVAYEDLLTRAAIMVTDYSGVQFDFAYQRKPVVYYQPPSVPPHYQRSRVFDYGRDGFGPVLTEQDALVAHLTDLMAADGRLEPHYRERADRFFAFDDHRNCERIYQALADYAEDPGSGSRTGQW